jgi:hypothetical protein
METLNIPQAELGEKNIFEEIFELLERHRLKLESNFPLGNFYDIVNDFDIAFQRFNSEVKSENNVQIFNDLLNYTVGNFLIIFKYKGFTDEPIFYSFKRFIAFFSMALSEANFLKNERDIVRNFLENFPSLRTDISKLYEDAENFYIHFYPGQEPTGGQSAIFNFEESFPNEIGINKDENEEEKIIKLYSNDFIAKNIIWNEKETSYEVIEEQFYMILEISINTKKQSIEKLLKPLWLIISALEQIENVSLELEDIFKGSLKASIKVWMKDLLAKEETKAVLETAKEVAVKALTAGEVSYADVKKSTQETKKLSLENTKLESELEQSQTVQEVKFERALDIQKKMLENEKLQIENAQAKINIIEQLSGLASKGIIEADMIRIDINDILYLLKEKDEIKEIGPNITEIS